MEITREERRRILESQSQAANREMRAFGRRLLVWLAAILEVVALWEIFGAENGTLRAVSLAVAVICGVGLLRVPAIRIFALRAVSAVAPLLARFGVTLKTLPAPSRTPPSGADFEFEDANGLDAAWSEPPRVAPIAPVAPAAQVAELGQPAPAASIAPAEVGPAEVAPAQVAPGQVAPVVAPSSTPAAVAEAKVAPAEAAPPARPAGLPAGHAAAPVKPQSSFLNWVLFAIICGALVLVVVAIAMYFAVHGGPRR